MPRATSRRRARTDPPRPAARQPKYVYSFANGKADGSSALRHLLGGKGCELAEMTNLGVSVPPGFTITTEAWAAYSAGGRKHPPGLWEQVEAGMTRLEAAVGMKLGDTAKPLLVSVRSGARASMPGMMDTVLNLGLNDRTVIGLARWTKNERFAWDCYRRFITIFSDVVLGIERRAFEDLLDRAKAAAHNRAIVRIVNALVDLLAQSREESLHTPGRPRRSHQDHRRILGAIRRRDEAGARRAMLDHLAAVEKLVTGGPDRRAPGRRSSKPKPRRKKPR